MRLTADCGDDVNEGEDCELTCQPLFSTPSNYVFEWQFKYKFTRSFQISTLGSTANPHIALLSAVDYRRSGTYRCSASGGLPPA